MGNQVFELPCADRKTRDKNLLNKYDRTKIYEENKDKPPRNQKILNQVENIIHLHERKTTKNTYIIEKKKREEFTGGSPLEPLSTFESNDIDSIKVDFSNKGSIIDLLNNVFNAEKVCQNSIA